MKVISKLITLEELIGFRFVVPIYQRLYVWGDDQVQTFLEDLITAYEQKKQFYFLGGILVVGGGDDEHNRYLELIDGQQRFTTLWMIAALWRKSLEPFLAIDEGGTKRPRLWFDIRLKVNSFLLSCVERAPGSEISAEIAASLQDAMEIIRKFQVTLSDVDGITEFIYRHVKMVLTTVPSGTDLNKLFEIINNRGVQLQHHEVLKALMLNELNDEERDNYATLWDACADMGEYVEQSLKYLARDFPIARLFEQNKAEWDEESLTVPACVLAELTNTEQRIATTGRQSLEEILRQYQAGESHSEGSEGIVTNIEERDGVRSIIGFPVFLQHVLRIWLKNMQREDIPRILDRELLTLFDSYFFNAPTDENKNMAENVRSFLNLLWELRYIFDKHIIKWVHNGEAEEHRIRPIDLDPQTKPDDVSRLVRDRREPSAARGFSLLQSMLYHSQQITTQYWLTPLLSFIREHKGHSGLLPGETRSDGYYRFLRHLDNQLFCTEDGRPLVERTQEFLKEPWTTNRHGFAAQTELRKHLGVGFPHYWFYKLEFILWYRYQNQPPPNPNMDDTRWKRCWKEFRFTAKNSVEHISPRTRQEFDRFDVAPEMLDRFGNLALVSGSENSEYSNRPFNEKKGRFWNRNDQRLSSLKSALIYINNSWTSEQVRVHEDEMVGVFEAYLSEQ